jgi:hypothetical protein
MAKKKEEVIEFKGILRFKRVNRKSVQFEMVSDVLMSNRIVDLPLSAMKPGMTDGEFVFTFTVQK